LLEASEKFALGPGGIESSL